MMGRDVFVPGDDPDQNTAEGDTHTAEPDLPEEPE